MIKSCLSKKVIKHDALSSHGQSNCRIIPSSHINQDLKYHDRPIYVDTSSVLIKI